MHNLILSCDDGCQSDVRVALLAEKYEIPCTFYFPVEWRSLALDNGYKPLNILEAYNIATKHTIGSHTVTHRHLTKIDQLEAEIEIADSKFMLEALFNQKITKFAPPRGYTNEYLTEYTLEKYDSQRLTRGYDADGYKLVHVHSNSGANDNKPWQECITDKTHLWFHSYDLDRQDLWEELESVLYEVSHS